MFNALRLDITYYTLRSFQSLSDPIERQVTFRVCNDKDNEADVEEVNGPHFMRYKLFLIYF